MELVPQSIMFYACVRQDDVSPLRDPGFFPISPFLVYCFCPHAGHVHCKMAIGHGSHEASRLGSRWEKGGWDWCCSSGVPFCQESKDFLRAPCSPLTHAKPTFAKAHWSEGVRGSILAAKEAGKMGNRMIVIEPNYDPLLEDGFTVALNKLRFC